MGLGEVRRGFSHSRLPEEAVPFFTGRGFGYCEIELRDEDTERSYLTYYKAFWLRPRRTIVARTRAVLTPSPLSVL